MSYLFVGKEVEKNFLNLIKNASFATDKEDIEKHIDIKQEIKIDVKGLRKTNRFDDFLNENIHWVELKNVHGKLGSLYGEADFFAFETEDYFIVVEAEKLRGYIKEKCSDKTFVKKPELYKLYQRENRKDVITIVKTIDLIYLSEKMIKK
jgi:hypothetical protein